MMVQFNFNRFKKLVCWSLTNDKSYFLRQFLQALVMLTLVFLAFTTGLFGKTGSDAHNVCCVISLLMLGGAVIVGPSLMFQSMKGEHSTEPLLMLPASNLEKYLVRWGTWLIILPLTILALFTADLIQYVFNLVLRTDYVAFVHTCFFNMAKTVSDYHANGGMSLWQTLANWLLLVIWFQSFYAVGGTFFRSHKYAWIQTTLSIIALLTVWIWASGSHSSVRVQTENPELVSAIVHVITLLWTAFNYWLSYRLFCRTQVIGRFVNY